MAAAPSRVPYVGWLRVWHAFLQAVMSADGFGLFRRACTRAGLFGFLVAFMAGFLVYGAALTAGTLVLKWAIIGRAKAGVHR